MLTYGICPMFISLLHRITCNYPLSHFLSPPPPCLCVCVCLCVCGGVGVCIRVHSGMCWPLAGQSDKDTAGRPGPVPGIEIHSTHIHTVTHAHTHPRTPPHTHTHTPTHTHPHTHTHTHTHPFLSTHHTHQTITPPGSLGITFKQTRHLFCRVFVFVVSFKIL